MFSSSLISKADSECEFFMFCAMVVITSQGDYFEGQYSFGCTGSVTFVKKKKKSRLLVIPKETHLPFTISTNMHMFRSTVLKHAVFLSAEKATALIFFSDYF